MVFHDWQPPWFDRKIEKLISYKNQIQKDTPKSYANQIFKLRYIQDLINKRISQAKKKYYENISHKLSDENLNPKKYWPVIKACELVNSYFIGQCTSLVNNVHLLTRFSTHTESILRSTDFSVEQVRNIIKQLDPNKAHGHGKISICMLKLGRDSINKP